MVASGFVCSQSMNAAVSEDFSAMSGPVTSHEQAKLKIALMAVRTCAKESGNFEYAEYQIHSHSDGKYAGIFRCTEGEAADRTYAAEIYEDGRGGWVLVPLESTNIR